MAAPAGGGGERARRGVAPVRVGDGPPTTGVAGARRGGALCMDEVDDSGTGPDIDIVIDIDIDICMGPGAIPGGAAYPTPAPGPEGAVVGRAPTNAAPYSCSIARCCMSYCGPRTGCSARRGVAFDGGALVRIPRRPCSDCCTGTCGCPGTCPSPCMVNFASPRSLSACSASARSFSSRSFCGADPGSPVTRSPCSVGACRCACCCGCCVLLMTPRYQNMRLLMRTCS